MSTGQTSSAPGAAGASNGALIERLVADGRPVRRLWPPSRRLAVWVALGAVVSLASAASGLRPDLRARLADTGFLLEVLSLFGAAVLLAGYSLTAAVPGRGPSRRQFIFTMGLAAVVWLIPVRYPMEQNLPLGTFIEMAAACERRTVMLACLPLAALAVALWRGAPVAGACAGSLAGAAAFLLASGNMRLVCPSDSRLHLLIGHSLPAVVGIGVAAIAGALWLRCWRSLRQA
jgi:hypothetical protein